MSAETQLREMLMALARALCDRDVSVASAGASASTAAIDPVKFIGPSEAESVQG
jgi:hypothetical protein